ncbi:phytanoyl-CoA dioxygenase family protein [Thalassomonas sp. RHCl1]|uniref:phytanoyl-CoA dioxygenase family protein n=1 Tax=Thalassomonas sp. RHCl1 TaxID=2995320 RepID=UPI00248B3E5F|nr:phytanoyl-CoA dioxygenase family protein [Thalassomonas sp. RHCl1]
MVSRASDISVESALKQLAEKGWVLIPSVYPESLMKEIISEFYQHEQAFIDIQKKKGIADKVIDATHHTPVLCRKMLKLLEPNKTHPILEQFFDGKYILNTMGLSKIRPGGEVYTQNIHRDVRSFHGAEKLWINTLIMLDDSTTENGATWVLEGSEHSPEKPDEEKFFKQAVRAEGKAGDVLLFDGHIWHCAGQNHSREVRHIITPFFSKPFIKQQLDYPRAFGPDFGNTCSAHLKQLLGYNALTPVSLDDFYQTDENRFYQSDQG